MIQKRTLLGAGAFTAAAGALSPARATGIGELARPAIADVVGSTARGRLIEDAFVFGLPIVMNYAIQYQFAIDRTGSQFKAPMNQMFNDARVFTYRDTAVPTPNSDTPYSMSWLDLRAEPVVISVPAVPAGRYYSVQLCDGNTYNYGYIGSRTTGQDAGSFLVAGPNWRGGATPPPGIKAIFRSSTQFGLTIFRTQLMNPDDMPNVVAIQRGYRVQPLSGFLRQRAPQAAPAIAFPRATADLVKHNFFEFLNFALQFNPAQPREREIRAKLAQLGIGTGRPFAPGFLQRIELDAGALAGTQKVDEAVANAGVGMNGWRVTPIPGAAEAYNGNWLLRAVAAKAGIYGNTTEEATYPLTRTDAQGQTLDGSQHRYTLTFPANGLPPVNAFWSVTMYDGRTQLLIQNPINRYLINSPMLPGMKRNPDGSLTLYIQRDNPGGDMESNWLPAPNGPIYLVMRLYWPKTEQPALLPIGQGQWQPPGIVRAG